MNSGTSDSLLNPMSKSASNYIQLKSFVFSLSKPQNIENMNNVPLKNEVSVLLHNHLHLPDVHYT